MNQAGEGPSRGRALIGWLPAEKAQRLLAGRDAVLADRPEFVERAVRAREQVRTKAAYTVPTDVIADLPACLNDHTQRFIASPEFAVYERQQWQIKMVDLNKVCALQDMVFHDSANLPDLPADPLAIARLTLPVTEKPDTFPLQFDEKENRFIAYSDNPNLRIVGNLNQGFSADNGRGYCGLGFLIDIEPSFMQVVRHKERYFLRDGYHRALGLLARGVHWVPVLFKEYNRLGGLAFGANFISAEHYLGAAPPMLIDYLDDTVSAEVQLQRAKTMIVVRAEKVQLLR